MEQRDYIIREIEKISTMLLGLLGKLRVVKSQVVFENERRDFINEFEEGVGISIDKIISADLGSLKGMLTREKGFDFGNIDILSDLLYEFSLLMDRCERKETLEKSITLLEFVDQEGKIFSMDRKVRIEKLRKEVETLCPE
ncbi:MAG: hypothetical protein QNK33_07665 [Bacteroidales bacterium]|nr:hypothetical protein [Bacteroidales bacterium]